MFFLSYACYACVCVCLFVPCGHLLEKGWLLALVWCVSLWVGLSLSHCYSRSCMVLDLINSDLCTLTYFGFTFFTVEIENKAH